MKFFRREEDDGQAEFLDGLRQRIVDAAMPEDAAKIAVRELETLSRTSPAAAEYGIGLAYLEYLVTLPWNKKTEDNLDLQRAERILDEDHFGLQGIKERIIEHLAVRVLRQDKRPRILVVDDEEIARRNLTHIFEKENYEVTAAVDGEDALRHLDSREFDVVVTDLRMPGVDGMEILRMARSRLPDSKVVMVTGFAAVDTAIEALKKGAFNYISKPFKIDEVRMTVKDALDSRAQLRGTAGSVLCFAGPPGTGKTSVGRSIARSLGRRFIRISLAGLKDEAEIRGHRRTYAGAMPGRIIEELHRAESSNPVIILDEVDKIGQDFKGDPSSALLEVLDPEQNRSFVDHYLDLPFDLSNIIFILTANVVDSIPAPLTDRMEIIEFSGYTTEEKIHIAGKFLVPGQIREKGLQGCPPLFTREALEKIIEEHTREAGIRNLERKLASICRKIARETVQSEGRCGAVVVDPESVDRYLGQRRYHLEVVEEADRVGIATGLVRTASGGDIIFVEAARMKGRKELILTGSLGEVMRESAQAALSYIRSNASSLSVPEDFFDRHDIHIHVPSGAIQKDGPSAGLTMAVALLSLLTNRPARRDVAMTGEITLTGRILPVSGLKEKILAARRAKVKTVVVPERNRMDIGTLPPEVLAGLQISFAETIREAIDAALLAGPSAGMETP